MENLSLIQIRDFGIVAIAAMGFIVLIGNVVKVFKEWRKPGMSEKEWRDEVDRKLGSDNERIKSLEAGNKALCKGMLALLSHEINGNSVDKLTKAQEELQTYLVDR